MVTYEIRKQGHCTTKRTHFHLRFIYSPDGCVVWPRLKKVSGVRGTYRLLTLRHHFYWIIRCYIVESLQWSSLHRLCIHRMSPTANSSLRSISKLVKLGSLSERTLTQFRIERHPTRETRITRQLKKCTNCTVLEELEFCKTLEIWRIGYPYQIEKAKTSALVRRRSISDIVLNSIYS